jgi:PIN domain nuclease of toxin-antitoxin system
MAGGVQMIILDTCVLLWLGQCPSKLSLSATSAMREDSDLRVVSISAWEIAMKANSGKLKLAKGLSAQQTFDMALSDFGLREIPLNSKIFCVSASLPSIHLDPCDRMIIAAAIVQNCPVITADKVFGKYPGISVVGDR